MYNPHLSQLGYLHPNEEEGVFLQFPLSTREILAQQICFCLLNGMASSTVLSTNVHVRIVMECVGQSFSLPLSASKIIESGIELYRKWVLEEKYRPVPIKEDEQFFLPEIIKQLSLVFVKRNYEEISEFFKDSKSSSKIEVRQIDPVAIHVGLCNQVLDLYRAIGRQFQNNLLNDTWDVFLKIVLGVADSMLHEPTGSSPVTEILKPNILNLLFELWIRAPRTEIMWGKLTDLIRKWKHRKDTYSQWSSTLYAINNRMLRLLYGPNQGTDSVLFKQVNGETIPLQIHTREMPNTWYRILHLLGHFEGSISNSENYLEAISGIEKVARSFIDLQKNQLTCKLPDGNSILNICGGWLLEAINHYQSGFNKGKEVALDVLCSLIDSRPQCKFNPNYLAFFYKGIEKALNTRHVSIVSVILTKCSRFFQSDIEGSNILIPAFVSSIERILLMEKAESSPELKQFSSLAELQRASLKILAALFCLPNHYKNTPFTSNSSKLSFTNSKLPTLTSYNDLHNHVAEMLNEAVSTINNVENLQLALILSSCYSFEVIDIPSQKSFVDRFINLLLDKLMIGKWDQKNVITSLFILSNLSTIFNQLTDSKIIAQKIVMRICKLIELKYFSQSSQDGDDVIINGLSCILQWILIDQWIINDRECLKQFLEIIDYSLNSKTSSQPANENEKRREELEINERVKLSAEYVFLLFINFLGNFPLSSGPDSLSSLHTEMELLEKYGLNSKALTSYMSENKIVNLIRFPRGDNGTEILIIIRDGIAKYVWKSKLNNFVEKIEEPPLVKSIDIQRSAPSRKIENIDPMLTQISTRLTNQEKDSHDYLLKSINSLHSLEEMKLRVKSIKCDESEALKAPVREKSNVIDEDLTVPRLFLSSWGINSVDNTTEFSQCVLNPGKLKDELNTFSALDQSRIRGCFSAAIMYYTTTNGFIYGNDPRVSNEYKEFLSHVGWDVKIGTHQGYNSGLSINICDNAPYYADFQSELIFRVATYSKNTQLFKNLVHDNSIYITWVEDVHSFSLGEFPFDYTANILIFPRPNSLYRIRIFLNRVENCGPLLDEMIVSKQILAHTLRLTVLNISKNLTGSIGKPLYLRKALIDLQKNVQQENQAFCFRKIQLSQFLS